MSPPRGTRCRRREITLGGAPRCERSRFMTLPTVRVGRASGGSQFIYGGLKPPLNPKRVRSRAVTCVDALQPSTKLAQAA
jgi:hypothetical protein